MMAIGMIITAKTGVTTMTTASESQTFTKQSAKEEKLLESCTSTASVSLVKRLRRRPVGWVSKKL